MIRWQSILSKRFASYASSPKTNNMPKNVKAFFSQPGYEVPTFLNNLTEEEQNTKIGPAEVNDIIIYYKLIQDTDHKNLTLNDISNFENRMLGVNSNQYHNPVILNDTFKQFLKRGQYFKYVLLLHRLPPSVDRTVYANMLFRHYTKDMDFHDGVVYIFKKLVKSNWSPSDITYSTMFYFNPRMSKQTRFRYLKESQKDRFYGTIIKNIIDVVVARQHHHYLIKNVSCIEEVLINAFRFSSKNLNFSFTAKLMDDLVENSHLITSPKYQEAFVNSLYEILWRSLSSTIYEIDHEFGPKTYKMIIECHEKDGKIEHVKEEQDDDDLYDEDFIIDEKTGQVEYNLREKNETKELSPHEVATTTIRRLYNGSLKMVMNEDHFFAYTDMILKSQSNIDVKTFFQIVSTMKQKRFAKITDANTKIELENTLYFIFADCLNPLNDQLYNELKSKKAVILKENPEFPQCRSMKVFYDQLKTKTHPIYWNAKFIEQFNTLLTASPENYGLYMTMKDFILSPEFLSKHKATNNFVYHKWLTDLSYFREDNPALVNIWRMTLLEDEFIDIVVTDRDSLINTQALYLKTWFNFGYVTGEMSEAAVLKNMQRLTQIFVKHMAKLNIKDEKLIEEMVEQYKKQFSILKKTKVNPYYKIAPKAKPVTKKA